MPEISRFFGIIIGMFYDEHRNIIEGDLKSRTATKLVREWIDMHPSELENDWELATKNQQLNEIEPFRGRRQKRRLSERGDRQ
uniref:Uncharacterized protein n=1 Tax=Candidatus Kentrum sp. TC TaxID=2126339 RepID=A0A450YAV0_9GAMM|nr:MAG: hypothetical protein BECKTC1821D_GA0114238_100527 [Candidatus Kentron sp. TC]VFK53153.1 MAG: hypothetical protein BECKTC1821F_GA0114240_100225 [Candidatus Kentron sp. TC]